MIEFTREAPTGKDGLRFLPTAEAVGFLGATR
jgi:hypothetical protein